MAQLNQHVVVLGAGYAGLERVMNYEPSHPLPAVRRPISLPGARFGDKRGTHRGVDRNSLSAAKAG